MFNTYRISLSDALTIEDLDALMQNYVDTTAEGNHEDHGWISDSYNGKN